MEELTASLSPKDKQMIIRSLTLLTEAARQLEGDQQERKERIP
jgi:hypothetical protein